MKYKYAKLSTQPGAFSIRHLHLLPSTDRDAELKCHLVETQIPIADDLCQQHSRANTQHEYQALSYTWGEPQFPKSLHVLPAGVIKITENLHSALQNLREPDNLLVLWVDAVCIDQENISERNSQVSNIPQTYANAASVLVWLGNDDFGNDGRKCLTFFAELANLIAVNLDRQDDPGSWRTRFEINQMVSKFLNSAQPRPIDSFLSRPWFRRRWIVQEVVLANEVLIHCGKSSIHWNELELALAELYQDDKGGFSDEHRTTLRTMSRIRHADSGAKKNFPLDTLVEFANFACANPKDRLYALYGVMQHWFPGSADTAQIGSIDYALSTGDVFTNFAMLMIKMNTMPPHLTYDSTTHVLQLAAAIQQRASYEVGLSVEERCEKIPSWVPDWTGDLTYTPLIHSRLDRDASCGIPKRQAMILTPKHGTRLLVSTGLVYDIITAHVPLDVSPLFGAVHEAKATLNNFLCSVAKCFNETGFFSTADKNKYRPTGEHIISALATALVANWEQLPANSYFSQDRQFPTEFLRQLSLSKHHLPEILHKWPAYVELITFMMRGRGLFLTKLGYIGICAANIKAGDVVCILSNTRIPFILRPKGGRVAALQDGFPSIPDSDQFQSEDQFKELISKIESEPLAHCTYQLMGDAFVHGLMNGEAASRFERKLGQPFSILPIA